MVVSLAVPRTLCSIDGLSYMDPINHRQLPNNTRRNEVEDPCHPLYWYPRGVPEHCNQQFMIPSGPTGPVTTSMPIRVPIPVPSEPIPYPLPFVPPPMPMPYPISPYQILPPPPPPPSPMIAMPYAMPIMQASPTFPAFPGVFPAQFPIPAPAPIGPQTGLVPAIRGLVSPEGGINIMPFSDAYSTMLEKHKHKMISKHTEYVKKIYGERKNYRRKKRLKKSRR